MQAGEMVGSWVGVGRAHIKIWDIATLLCISGGHDGMEKAGALVFGLLVEGGWLCKGMLRGCIPL